MTTEPRYTIPEAAARIGCKPLTLRDRCTKGTVPHHRAHGVRGIYFTDADIAEIIADQARPVRSPGPHATQADGGAAPTERAPSSADNGATVNGRTTAAPPPGRYATHVKRGG